MRERVAEDEVEQGGRGQNMCGLTGHAQESGLLFWCMGSHWEGLDRSEATYPTSRLVGGAVKRKHSLLERALEEPAFGHSKNVKGT